MLKTSTDFFIKTCRSLKRRATLKIPSTVFRRTYILFFGFKMASVLQCYDKKQLKYSGKLAERSKHWFLLCTFTTYLSTFLKHLYSLTCGNGMCRT